MFDEMTDLELLNEYIRERSPPSLYAISFGSAVLALLWRYLRMGFYITIIMLLLIILVVIARSGKNKIDKEELLKKEIIKRGLDKK